MFLVNRRGFNLFLIFIGLPFFVSCDKDEDNDPIVSESRPIDRGDIVVEDLYLVFNEKGKMSKDTFYYNASNSKPSDSIHLKKGLFYDLKVHFLNESSEEVNDDIKQNAVDYIVCHLASNSKTLRLMNISKDENGDKFGLESKWQTAEATNVKDSNTLEITLNYQSQEKDDFCDPGVRLIKANFNYSIN